MVAIIEHKFAKSFKDLEVYRKAYLLALSVHKITLTFPKIEQYALADQMRRASKSICANIAEGFGRQRQSKAEFRRFLSMAIGSSEEILVWLDFALDLEYISATQKQEWQKEYESVQRMLYTLHAKS